MKKNKPILILALCALTTFSNAQSISIEEFKTVQLDNPATDLSTDRDGNVYLVDSKQDVHKYDSTGKKLLTYSPEKMADASLFEAWNSISIILFYKDFQEFVLLDRFLTLKSNNIINSNLIGFARVATLSADNNIWMIDDSDFSLKKYDLRFNNLKVHNPLDLILDPSNYDIVFIREYHNQLYVLDRLQGVLVFDNLGNFRKKLPIKELSWIGFYNDQLYYLENNKLVLFDLYGLQKTECDLPDNSQDSQVLINSGFLYLSDKKEISIFKLKITEE